MKTKLLLILVFSVCLVLLAVTGCKKDEDTDTQVSGSEEESEGGIQKVKIIYCDL